MRFFSSLFVMALVALASAAQAAPPNIVLIMADDLGYGEVGPNGQTKIRTPSLDRMAREGMRLTRFYAGSPVCASSRCVLMTGKHSGHAIVRTNREIQPEGQFPLPDGEVTIAELLKKQGYTTAAIGKWGLGPPGSSGDPNQQGFDLFYGYNCQRHAHNHYPVYLYRNRERETLEGNTAGVTGKHHSHDRFEAEALGFIRENQERPFFLYLPFTIPHLALQVPDDSLAEYRGKWDDPAYEGGKGYLPHPHPRAAYAAMVTRMDRSIGRILDLLQELKLAENTLVLFTSDNGPTYDRLGGSDSDFFESAAGLRGRKGSVYEGGLRVPLLAWWPGKITAGETNDLPCASYDLLPTLCEVAGATPPKETDGLSIVPTLTARGEQQRHPFLYWEFPAYGSQQAVLFDGRYKAVRQQMQRRGPRTELYDLASDPAEERDIAASSPELVKRAEAIFEREHVPSSEFPLPGIDRPPQPARNKKAASN